MVSSRNWPDRVGEAFSRLLAIDPKIAEIFLATKGFRHPQQAFLALRLPREKQPLAARKLIAALQADEDAEWTSDLVELVSSLPPMESFPIFREAWEQVGVRDAVLKQLAQSPYLEDRERFVEALASWQASTVELAARALLQLKLEPETSEITAVVQALRQACARPQDHKLRVALLALLQAWSGEKWNITEPKLEILSAYQPCFQWFEKHHPEAAKRLVSPAGTDISTWQTRFEKLAWEQGDLQRGRQVFEKMACAKCHAGNSPLGPDLRGAAGRFSQLDLFTAILDPNRDIAPPYQVTQFEMANGHIIQGIIVYESPDGTLITTAPETTVRVSADQVASIRKVRQSLMPTGLLNQASDGELIDLYAYLKSLNNK